jgi:hypothetical protein
MTTTLVQIAGRSFQVGKLRMGPIWENPEAFAHIHRERDKDKFVDVEQMKGMVKTVYHAIDWVASPPSLTEDEFTTLVCGLPFDQATNEVSAAFVVAMTGAAFEKRAEGTGAGEA